MTMEVTITLRPVGVVRNEGGGTQRIEIHGAFSEGLDAAEEMESLWVLYWMHRLSEGDRKILRVHPRGDPANPMRGVFATRSPARPNPIGLTRVHPVRREGNALIVEGLDALDGSPVLDLKSA